jgi:cytochrome c oxidase cbb3-type subunit 3
MISWESQLGPGDMRDVASYILTLQGTTPANPKAPEGELYVPPVATGDSTSVEETIPVVTTEEESATAE